MKMFVRWWETGVDDVSNRVSYRALYWFSFSTLGSTPPSSSWNVNLPLKQMMNAQSLGPAAVIICVCVYNYSTRERKKKKECSGGGNPSRRTRGRIKLERRRRRRRKTWLSSKPGTEHNTTQGSVHDGIAQQNKMNDEQLSTINELSHFFHPLYFFSFIVSSLFFFTLWPYHSKTSKSYNFFLLFYNWKLKPIRLILEIAITVHFGNKQLAPTAEKRRVRERR